MSKLFLSACAIMKNEEKHIGRWLECVRQVADEIIVVDTGSTDRTVALAQAGGARVCHFPWVNDFSAAKNFALDQASGNWIVFLDADEFFTEASLPKIRPLLKKADRNWKIAGLVCRLVNVDEDRQMELQGATVQMRLFRHSRKLRFRGAVHEMIDVPEPYLMVATQDIEIHHTGYSSALIQQKLLRNQELLQNMLAQSGGQPSLKELFYLLDCAYGMGKLEEGQRLAEAVLGDERRSQDLMSDELARVHSLHISILIKSGCAQDRIEAALDQAERAFPKLADFPLMAGIYHADAGDTVRALKELQQGLALYKTAGQLRDSSDLNVISGNAERLANTGCEYMQRLKKKKKNKGLKISACAIVKNEAANLSQWLDSVRGFADEIIVVDTGSTDGTAELAATGGARVYHFDWIDDFSAAKNFAIAQAKGDWIAFLDADETFSMSSRQEVRPLLERLDSNRSVRGVACSMVNIDRDDHNRYMSEKLKVRLFRKLPDIRYTGRIHETLEGLPDSRLHQAKGLLLYHTGYSSSLVRQKLERNLGLLQRQAEKEGRVLPEDYHYYMDCYYGLDDYPQAINWSRKVIEDTRQSSLLREEAWETYLSSLVRGCYPADTALAAFDEARKACPDMPRFTLMQGLYLFSQKDYLRAETLLREGLAAPSQGEGRDIRRLQPHALSRLAELAFWQGRTGEAAEGCIEALQLNRYLADTVCLLAKAMQQSGLDEAAVIEILSGLYEREDAPFLAGALRSLGGKLAIFYARRAGEPADSEASYAMTGQWGAAAELLTRRLSLLTLLSAWQAEKTGDSGLWEKLRQLMSPAWQEAWESYRADPEQTSADWRIRAWQQLDR